MSLGLPAISTGLSISGRLNLLANQSSAHTSMRWRVAGDPMAPPGMCGCWMTRSPTSHQPGS